MTLGIAWVRRVRGVRELPIGSDSRLSGGQYWDSNPKIMLLPRTDAAVNGKRPARSATDGKAVEIVLGCS